MDKRRLELAGSLIDLANAMYKTDGPDQDAAIVLYSLAGALRDDERALAELARITGEFSKEMLRQHKWQNKFADPPLTNS